MLRLRAAAGEVVRLTVGDIDSEQMIIRIVQSKGRKDRHVMLPRQCSICCGNGGSSVPAIMTHRRRPNRWLFPGRSEHVLTTRQFSRLFKEAAQAAGLSKPSPCTRCATALRRICSSAAPTSA